MVIDERRLKGEGFEPARWIRNAAVLAALAAVALAAVVSDEDFCKAQQAAPTPDLLAQIPLPEPATNPLPIGEDHGCAALEQDLKRLGTTASVLMIVAHPDDEDGALLTYLSRGLGVRATLLTLTRGEGGQNAMSADSLDALGLIRTQELLKAGEYYGRKQLWGTEADFGFSKTQEEAFAKWTHERVLYDAVLAVRRERPQILVSTFVGGITDGHGHHQVSGEIMQEAFKAAGDPKVFPEQLKDGLEPWQPLAVYSMVPFAPVTDGRMFDYATGKWAPARFHNYVTDEWTTEVPSADVVLPVGTLDPYLGQSYTQIAREGWGQQKSQNGGANPTLSGPATTRYHLWAVDKVASPASLSKSAAGAGSPGAGSKDSSLFQNRRVGINTTIAGLARLAGPDAPAWIATELSKIDADVKTFTTTAQAEPNLSSAHKLVPIYRQALDLRERVATSALDPAAKANLLFELDTKIEQFQTVLKDLLGIEMVAFTTHANKVEDGGFRGSSADETPRSVTPGEDFNVRIHVSTAMPEAHVEKTWFVSQTGDRTWKSGEAIGTASTATTSDAIFKLHVPENAEPTEPYFTRPNTEQPYYDLLHPEYRERSFAPWPLSAWVEFTFDGAPVRMGQVVQTLGRELGPGGVYEPLVVTPKIGVRVEPEARILPLDGSPLPVRVTVHSQGPADGTVELKLPAGWVSEPSGTQANFHFHVGGDSEPMVFEVTPAPGQTGAFTLEAVAHSGGHDYSTGWQRIGYQGLPPYNLYRAAEMKTRKVDVKLAPGLKVAYVMGTGDTVPEALEALGVEPHLLSAAELKMGDLSAWNVIVIGIRAYSVRPELAPAAHRLQQFVENGGTVVVQYQSANFPAPLPLSMGGTPERVVDETDAVKLLEPDNPLLSWPNKITTADFDGWVEERGHSFLNSWDPGYTALTETADPGQDPQRGGLLVAHPGKGTYIYVAYALYRQFPELVQGPYRIMANLLSAGKEAR
jgi:LmbE family N-acetylglucosaminyl deacetylase